MTLSRSILFLVALAACGASEKPLQVYYGPAMIEVPGNPVVTETGLSMSYQAVCRNSYVYASGPVVREEPCEREGGPREIEVVTPWKTTHAAKVTGASRGVTIDWAKAPIDPLAPYAAEGLRGWAFVDVETGKRYPWVPGALEIDRMLDVIGVARGVERYVRNDGHPPKIEVERFEVVGSTLLADNRSTFVLTLRNAGRGGAYRLVAHLRSSLEAVPKTQLSFGAIESGARETREVTVDIGETDDKSAMVVLRFEEANGYAPANFSHRFPVSYARSPKLRMGCKVLGAARDGDVEVDAGKPVRVQCDVSNIGSRVAQDVTVELRLGGGNYASGKRNIPAGKDALFVVQGRIPNDAAVDTRVEAQLTARERSESTVARASVHFKVRVPTLCPGGRLTRAQYRAKRAELKRARDAGALSREEFDRYDAALVGCLE